MTKSAHRKGQLPFQFVALPTEVIRSAEWRALPHSARALAIDLLAQYTGKNNGRLCPSFVAMSECGWTSKQTLANAKRALLETDFFICTRKGHPPRTAEWIGFTWQEINFDPSMDISPRSCGAQNFSKVTRTDPNEGRGKAPKQSNSCGTKIVPITSINAL